MTDIAERFNDRYTALLRSATWKRIHRTAYGDEYPEGTNTNGFYSRTTLQWLCDALRRRRGALWQIWVVATADRACGLPGTRAQS